MHCVVPREEQRVWYACFSLLSLLPLIYFLVPKFHRPFKFVEATKIPLFQSPSGASFLCITHLAFSNAFIFPIPPGSIPKYVLSLFPLLFFLLSLLVIVLLRPSPYNPFFITLFFLFLFFCSCYTKILTSVIIVW